MELSIKVFKWGLAMVSAVAMVAAGQVSVDSPGWFDFTISPVADGSGGAGDVSFLNPGAASSRISVRGEDFVNAAGRSVRFIGTNVTFSGAFPDKADAPAIAKRMAQLGFNVVRFHHMDARDIWLPGQEGLDPEKLDRLDWFIFQLKQNGIYVNINLHVSRTYPGLREYGMARTFRYGKIVDTFYEPYIRMQEEYASELLDRVNPYTRMKLSADPAVAFVELNNENSLLNLTVARLGALTAPPLRASLRGQWASFLQTRYSDLAALTAAWNADLIPLGTEMVRNPRFEGDLSDWTLEGRKPGVCGMQTTLDDRDQPALHISMTEKGAVSWAYQLHQLDVDLEEGMVYTLSFRARAEPARRVSPALRLAGPPWTVFSPGAAVTLTPAWRDVSIVLPVTGVVEDARLRMSLNLGDAAGDFWVSSISLRSGQARFTSRGVTSLSEMVLPEPSWPPSSRADFRLFLVQTERAYVSRLRRHLREAVGVRSLIVDTQASYGGIWGTHREALLSDYIDMHSYWQHPRFPGKPWDGGNWLIPNTSMVRSTSGGTFARLSACRVSGMPFSVSEYNHPAPNDHAAELFPMLSAFACHQDWDALYQFAYCNRAEGYSAGRIRGYFELCHHPAQVVFAPISALIFRRGLIPPASARLTATVPMGVMHEALGKGGVGLNSLTGDATPIPRMLSARFGIAFSEEADSVRVTGGAALPGEGLIHGEHLAWHVSDEKAVFRAVAPAARVFIGEVTDEAIGLGDASVELGLPGGTWVCFAMASTDGKALSAAGRILLAVATRAENSHMGWNEERTTVGKNWGQAPVVAEFVPFKLRMPGREPERVLVLDSVGRGVGECKVQADATGGWSFRSDASQPSLWYAAER